MMSRCALLVVALTAFSGILVQLAPVGAQVGAQFAGADDARSALTSARQQQRLAGARAARLDRQAQSSDQTAEKAMRQAAALAARIQMSEAAIAASEAELGLARQQRRALDRSLAAKREPLARLAGALHSMAQRPAVLSALQPGSLTDIVHTRAVMSTAMPIVRARTANLRADLERARALEQGRRRALADMQDAKRTLAGHRRDLVAMAQRERVASRRAAGNAEREAARALAMSERARDLDTLVGEFESAASLRSELAALPGPVPRPGSIRGSGKMVRNAAPKPANTGSPRIYQLPVAGRIVTGFGEAGPAQSRATGITLLPRGEAQVVSPGSGRVAFAGPYKGYGAIVIVEHDGGWISLVTGLDDVDALVGTQVTAGSPLGQAQAEAPRITLELRHDGKPVNPIEFLR